MYSFWIRWYRMLLCCHVLPDRNCIFILYILMKKYHGLEIYMYNKVYLTWIWKYESAYSTTLSAFILMDYWVCTRIYAHPFEVQYQFVKEQVNISQCRFRLFVICPGILLPFIWAMKTDQFLRYVYAVKRSCSQLQRTLDFGTEVSPLQQNRIFHVSIT